MRASKASQRGFTLLELLVAMIIGSMIMGSLLFLVVGTLSAVWVWRSHQPQLKKSTAVYYEPPTDLPPAIAGVLNGSGASPSWANALATLFDLAERGILTIEEIEKQSRFSGQDFNVVLLKEPGSLRPHEQGLLNLLFETKEGRETAVKLSKLSSAVTGSQWKKFAEPLEAEIKAAGYIDAERKSRRTRVMVGSFVYLIVAVLSMILTAIFENQFGMWPMAVAVSFFALFIILISTGISLTILTDEARLMADEWQSFYQHLKDVTRKKAAVGETNMFNRFLPYAASYGLLHQWAKFFQKEGWTELPPYFHALNRADDGGMAAFVAMTAASSSSGGSAAGAGAAGAGAAGGGASGAG
jgi:prepilin-type N-terminal cleavage/methylation domain-containing protein